MCDGVPEVDLAHAKVIWDYMTLNQVITKSDVLLCLCSYDTRVAEKAASLWLQGMADIVLFSGNVGQLTEGLWTKPEAVIFADVAIKMGVPTSKILIEPESRNSGENVRFCYEILREKGVTPSSIILVQKPYMERRALATFMKQWPGCVDDMTIHVTSPEVTLTDYPNEVTGSMSRLITVLLGDMARIKDYEEKGFQIHQDVPQHVQVAFDKLIQTKKYNGHLPK